MRLCFIQEAGYKARGKARDKARDKARGRTSSSSPDRRRGGARGRAQARAWERRTLRGVKAGADDNEVRCILVGDGNQHLVERRDVVTCMGARQSAVRMRGEVSGFGHRSRALNGEGRHHRPCRRELRRK